MHSTEFIKEGINDKGIFKAVFLAGLPGAGKTTIAQKITDGAVGPRHVNTDIGYEHLLQKHGVSADTSAWALYGPQSKSLNKEMLYQYLNSMLPLFVDGTSSNSGALIRRQGILESLGYDTAMVWINIDLETAIHRVQQRERKVDPKFIRDLHSKMEQNKQFFKGKFGSNFIEVDNNNDNFDAMESKTASTADKFFSGNVNNPIGSNTIIKMQENSEKYLIPNIYSPDHIKRMISVWYQR